ncbi:MAG TPA: sigma-54 dependent transcriptional regulator [Candidatus Tectomicrobia bacterium]|jgi:two-component system, NtrC family, response regulator HydG|nr:sigma-54 dependent transcriptional regulator [Candidatus Tectomicrobia bacterium]
MADILIVDDEPAARTTLGILLRKRGHRVVQAEGAKAAAKTLAEMAFDLVVTDLRMPDGDGLEVLRAARGHCPEASVILLTAYAGWESAKEAMRLGAFDYFEKGKEPDEFLHRVDKALEETGLRRENENLRRQVRERYSLPGIIGHSKEMQQALDLVMRVAPTDATILIQGESGTGKEVIAKAIHHTSPRAQHAFVAVNCGALPEPLLESEIFGHVKGAFTGATVHKKGLFEDAHGGTFFLDEIGDMPLSLQVKFLRVLQEGEIRRVGSNQATTVDVRVLAATNRDLGQLMQQGQFREDLYYRLNVIPLVLPPLRERREDIPALAEHFLRRFGDKQHRPLSLTASAVERLLRYPWPGNVRELENAMERTAILARNDLIGPDELPPHIASGTPLGPAPVLPREQTLAEVEKSHILQTLERCGWNHSHAAEALGIGRTSLWRKLKEYQIEERLR